MSTDDSLRQLMATQEAMRRATDPLGDAMRRVDMLTKIGGVDVEGVAARILHQDQERVRLLVSAASSLPRVIDIAGLTKLADQAASHSRLLAGPLENFRKLDVIGTSLAASLGPALTIAEQYKSQFRLPELNEMAEISRLAREVMSPASVVMKAYTLGPAIASVTTAMQSMHAPWLHRENALQSISAFAEIQAIGHAINAQRPFDSSLTTVLRNALGDWRGIATFAPSVLENPVIRSDFYVELGFDPSLTDFPTRAFDESTTLAGIGADEVEEQDKEVGLERNVRAYNQLLRFERDVRAFISHVMETEFGSSWIKQQTPGGMLDEWKEKRQAAVAKGEEEQPLICYADFTDYAKIIARKDNWERVFKDIFGRREDVQESFIRLFPVRICTMHARIITLDDEFLMRVETRRIRRAIDRA